MRLPAPKRYEYFIKKVVDFEEVWGAYCNGWVIADDGNGNVVIPFWPKEQFVQLCAQGVWQGYTARSIPLEDFLSKWLPGMQKDSRKPAIFYTADDRGIVVEIERLLQDINEEMQKY